MNLEDGKIMKCDIPIMMCPHCNRIYFDNDMARLFKGCDHTIESEDFRMIGILRNVTRLKIE